jgi:hypothetical protein
VKPATFTREGERVVIRPGSGLPLEADWYVTDGSWSCELDSIRYTVTVTALPLDEYLPMAMVTVTGESAATISGDQPVVVVAEWRERVGHADEQDRLEQAYASICVCHRWVNLLLIKLADEPRATA